MHRTRGRAPEIDWCHSWMMIPAMALGFLAAGMAAAQVAGTSWLLLNRAGQSQAYDGVGRFRGGGSCTACFLKPVAGGLADSAPAYVITGGHCISMQGPSNEVILDRPASNVSVTFGYFIDTQDQQARFNAKRIAYSSMKGTDIAIVELDATYGQVAGKGYRPLEFSRAPPAPGEGILITGIPSSGIPSDQLSGAGRHRAGPGNGHCDRGEWPVRGGAGASGAGQSGPVLRRCAGAWSCGCLCAARPRRRLTVLPAGLSVHLAGVFDASD